MPTLNALGLAEDLQAAGFPRDQAHGMARAIRDRMHQALVTKQDRARDVAEVPADMRAMESRLEAKINEAKASLVMWLAGMMIAQAAAIVALVKLLPGGGS
jgi:hypothetical protein